METLESSRVCRLCGKQSGISIHIFDKNENHVKKINAVLPIMVHEMDLLPKHMCHRCSYKLEEFHKFYVDCLKTDADLKSQLSWMNNEDANQRVGIPMVHIENIKIKVEPPDYDAYDLNPVVANVNYINFPVNSVQPNDVHNGIAYTAYTRCRCCCDKTDQSSRTVPASYEDTVPSCDRLSNLEADDVDVRADKSLVVKKNVLTDKAFQERSSFRTTRTNEGSDSSTCRPSSNSYTYSANVNSSGNESVSKSPVRNLRPRSSVNYVETRKKSQPTSTSNSQSKTKTPGNKIGVSGRRTTKFEVSPVKIENLSELEGRILRPRKKTVDYNVDKGKYVKGLSKARRSQDDERRAKRPNVENIPSELTLPSTTNLFDTVKLEIKEEQLSDLDDTKVNELITLVTPSHLLDNCETSSSFVVKEEPLPNNPFVSVQKDRVNGNTSKQPRRGATARAPSKFKPLRTVPNRNLKSGPKHVGPIRYAPKYLRSQDVFLRNGKTWKFESIEVSARTVQRSRATGRSLMKALRNMKKVPPSLKLLEDIKHYCEKCDISFPCKEIFRLHACYR